MMLNKESWVRLSTALLDAMSREEEFVELARRLEWSPSEVVGFNSTGRRRVQAFIEYAEMRDRVADLLAEACVVSEGNQKLAGLSAADLVPINRAPRAGESLTEGQRDRIAMALSTSFGETELVSIVTAANKPDRSSAWNEGPPTPTNIRRFIAAAAEEGWILRLLREAIANAPGDAQLTSLAAEAAGPVVATLPDMEEVWKEALERRMFPGGFFLINRSRLRSSMSLMLPTVGNRILVVRGSERSGLSHSVRLISYLSEACGGFATAVVDLEEASRFVGPKRSLTPRDLAREIISELRYDFPLPVEPSMRQWPAWNVDFARAFAQRADDDPRRMFLVLDRLHKVQLSRATTDFVQVLSTYIGTRLPAFRLVLVGFRGDLPDGVRQARLVDETSALTKRDLVEFFARVYQEANVPLDPPQLKEKVRKVLDGQMSYPPGNLVDLSDRVQGQLPGMTS
jgi:hypothetical protein